MKSLSDTYTETHGSTHETFADLMFCALVVLVLFVMALAIEVSQRIRAELVTEVSIPDPVEVVEAKELSTMTKEEVEELSKELQKKSSEIQQLKEQLDKNVQIVEAEKEKVESTMAALSGEQRFTGAREPASLNMAYDYDDRLFYFLSAREVDHAGTMKSGESTMEFAVRSTSEQVDIALKARKQRGYTMEEAKAIYQAFSQYRQVKPEFESYTIENEVVGISYNTRQSAFIAGEQDPSSTSEALVVSRLLEVYKTPGEKSDEMYPRIVLKVDEDRQTITTNGVTLSPRDLKEILLSIDGRGAMIDLEGLKGKAPEWLKEQVLIPAGYISGLPKLPSE